MPPTTHRTRPLHAQAAVSAAAPPLVQASASVPRPQPPAPPGRPVGFFSALWTMMTTTAVRGFVIGLLGGFALSLFALAPEMLQPRPGALADDSIKVLAISSFLGVAVGLLVGLIGMLSGALQGLVGSVCWAVLDRHGQPSRRWPLYRGLSGLAPSLAGGACWLYLAGLMPRMLLLHSPLSAPLWPVVLRYLPAALIALAFWQTSGRLAAWYARSRGAGDGPLLLYADQPDLHDPAFQQALFERMQPSYTRGMRLLSAGQDQRLRRQLAALLDLQPGMRVCDLMSGSGEMWAPVLERIGPRGSIAAVERSPAMLEAARRRAAGLGQVTLHPGDALQSGLPSASFDAVLCAFGSTLLSPIQCMALADEIQRLLDHHGIFGIIDLRLPRRRLARADYRFYLRRLAPLVSPALLSRPRYVRLLGRYADEASDGSELEAMLRMRGLQVYRYSLLGGRAVALVGMNIRSVPPQPTQ